MGSMISGKVFAVMILAMWSLIMPLILGSYNSIYLNTVSAGEYQSERFDRVVSKGTAADAEEAWQAVTGVIDHGGTAADVVATSAYKLGDASGSAEVTATTLATTVWYTPSGTEIASGGTAGELTNVKWKARSPIFGVFNGFARILLQVIALSAPIGFMFAMSYFGHTLMTMMGGSPIMRVVLIVIGVLVAAILFNILLPYVGDVFYAIDKNRFVVFDQELGLIAGLVRNFFGVILVAGFISAAWSVGMEIKNGIGSGQTALQGSGM